MSGFEELGLMHDLIHAVEDMDWYLPKPVQQDAIPLILGGGDVMCAAETGSGKTGAFCLPILQITWETLNRRGNERSAAHCAINREDCNSNCRLSEDLLQCQCHDPRAWSGARCNYGVKEGKWYFEASVEESGGIIRVGLSTLDGTLELGKDALGFGYGGTGKKSFNNQFDDYGGAFGMGDIIGVGIDFSGNGSIHFWKNGKHLGAAFTSIPSELKGKSLHPAMCIKNSRLRLIFSKTSFLPDGFRPFDEAKGPDQDEVAAMFQRRRRERATGTSNGPTCIVVEPTLELANQVVEECIKFSKYLTAPSLKVCSIIGKRDFREISTELKRGVDIVVATPGKLESFVDSGTLPLDNVRFFVMDEADRFATEYLSLILKLYQRIQNSNNGRTQVCMFSATLHSPEIKTLAEEVCPKATWVDHKGKEFVPETVHHGVVYVDPKEEKWEKPAGLETDGVHRKDRMQGEVYVSEGSKVMKPQVLLKIIDAYKMEQCLIFCRTRVDCDNLAAFLTQAGGRKGTVSKTEKGKENSYSNVALHSGFSARERADNLQLFKEGYARFLICTDVAARGIDIASLPYVVNMTLPDKPEDYIHRIGRTGRADRMGLAISIVSRGKEKVWYHTCPSRGENCFNTDLAQPVPRGPPGKMEGGCCIWYNEPEKALAIQQRLGQPFDELDDKTFKYHVQGADEAAVSYGKSRQEATRAKTSHDEAHAADVLKVADLDRSVQVDYHLSAGRVRDIVNGLYSGKPQPKPAQSGGRVLKL